MSLNWEVSENNDKEIIYYGVIHVRLARKRHFFLCLHSTRQLSPKAWVPYLFFFKNIYIKASFSQPVFKGDITYGLAAKGKFIKVRNIRNLTIKAVFCTIVRLTLNKKTLII